MARPDVSVARRNQILATAAMVFARHGFNQARMDDIVKESGLSKGAIYWYFKSKDEIIIELVRRFFDRELHEWQALVTSDAPVCERLLHASRLLADELQHNRDLVPLMYEFYALAPRQEAVRQVLQSYIHSYRNILIALLQQGIERGEIRPVDPAEAATALTALYEGLVIIELAESDTIPFRDLSEKTVQLFIDGLRPFDHDSISTTHQTSESRKGR